MVVEGPTGRRILEGLYAKGLRAELALLVRGSSRRITIMRSQPANIRVINRRGHLSTITAAVCPRVRFGLKPAGGAGPAVVGGLRAGLDFVFTPGRVRDGPIRISS